MSSLKESDMDKKKKEESKEKQENLFSCGLDEAIRKYITLYDQQHHYRRGTLDVLSDVLASSIKRWRMEKHQLESVKRLSTDLNLPAKATEWLLKQKISYIYDKAPRGSDKDVTEFTVSLRINNTSRIWKWDDENSAFLSLWPRGIIPLSIGTYKVVELTRPTAKESNGDCAEEEEEEDELDEDDEKNQAYWYYSLWRHAHANGVAFQVPKTLDDDFTDSDWNQFMSMRRAGEFWIFALMLCKLGKRTTLSNELLSSWKGDCTCSAHYDGREFHFSCLE